MQACSAMQTRSCIQFCMKAGGGAGDEHGGKGECGVGGAGGGQLPSGGDYKKVTVIIPGDLLTLC